MPAPPLRDARLDLRVPGKVKLLLEDAAAVMGLTTSAFILAHAVEKANNVLNDHRTILLNQEEHQRFISVLDNPPEPNENLVKLFKKYE